jgi:hypothetical protein
MNEQHTIPEATGPPTFMQVCDEIREKWLCRVKSEAELANQLVTKVTAARSIPDTTAAYGEWMTRHMEMLGEDNRRLWADVQKLMEASTRYVSIGVQQRTPIVS